MKETKDIAISMIKVFQWHIGQLTDISPYGPPTKHIFFWQKYGGETREEALLVDLERLKHWEKVLKRFE